MKKNIAEAVEELCAPLAGRLSLEIYDVEYVKEGPDRFLRVYIDKPGAVVSIEDCEALSRLLDPALDEADLIPERYYLEVSSVGLDRPLKKEKDFRRFMGEKIEVRLFKALAGRREFTGRLMSFDNGIFEIMDDGGQAIKLDIKDAGLIRPWIEF